jgi:hypothetical protein
MHVCGKATKVQYARNRTTYPNNLICECFRP